MKKFISLIILIIAVATFTQPWWSVKTQQVTINKTERVEGSYLVYSDKGVFRNEDTWYYFKFDSSDLYNNLRSGETYSCKSYGFRVPLFSMYPNLVKCQ